MTGASEAGRDGEEERGQGQVLPNWKAGVRVWSGGGGELYSLWGQN